MDSKQHSNNLYRMQQQFEANPEVLVSGPISLRRVIEEIKQQERQTINKLSQNYEIAFVFAWDDLLFATTGINRRHQDHMDRDDNQKLLAIDRKVAEILRICLDCGRVFILTRTAVSWISFSSLMYMPATHSLLYKSSIQVISTRDQAPGLRPHQQDMRLGFKFILKELSDVGRREIRTQLVVLGGSVDRMIAANRLVGQIPNTMGKMVLGLERPSLNGLCNQFENLREILLPFISNPNSNNVTLSQ